MMFAAYVAHVVDQLTAVGIRAALDPADLNPPAVWVMPATLDRLDLADAHTSATLTLYLVTGSAPAATALATLDQLAAQVHQVFTLAHLEAVTVNLPNLAPGGLPGYRATLTLEGTTNP